MNYPDHEDTAQNRTQGPRECSNRDTSSCDACGRTDCSASTRNKGESEQEFADRQKLQSGSVESVS